MFAAVEHCCGADPSMCKCCCRCLRPPSTPAHLPSHLPLLQCSNSKIRSLVVDMEGGLEAMAALGWQQAEEEGEQVLTLAKGAATMAQVRRGGTVLVPAHARRGSAAGGKRWHAWVRSSPLPSQLAVFCHCCFSCIATASGHANRFKSSLLLDRLPSRSRPQVRLILEAQQEFKKSDRQLKRAKSSASLPGSEEQAALRAQIEADRCGALAGARWRAAGGRSCSWA